ncbi:MAG: aspartate--tRNA ligase [Mycoplasma sp.]
MHRVYCGKVSQTNLNEKIKINGWVKKNRKLGGLIFLDIGDRFGIVQVVLNNENKHYESVLSISKESVVEIIGTVKLRSSPNESLPTGAYEIHLEEITVLSKSENTPFVVEEDADASEDIRLKYRYLDLRRNVVRDKIIFRSNLMQSIRKFFVENEFIEVETPSLCRPTPEGAKDYLVPTRNYPGSFYALPQSPQTFKQLLMLSGFEKYFQIVKCFRDEQLRSDRQPEFTQLDIECSFVNEIDIQNLIEKLFKKIFKEFMDLDLTLPFVRMDYDEAMNSYGNDKPDLRFENKILDVTKEFANTNFKIFQEMAKNNKTIKCLCFENHLLNKKQHQALEKFAKDNKAKGLAWATIENNKVLEGSIINVVEHEILLKIANDNKTSTCTLLFVADTNEIALKSLGSVRTEAAKLFEIIDENKFAFAWIVNWPLYEYDEDANKFSAAHHPFTSPAIENFDNFDKDQLNARARSYDIVLNGYEVGGGSIRIIDPNIQMRMFKSLSLSDEEIMDKFGFLINAFKYGVPPHGGIALGLDRLLMIMLKTPNIKDVICFPKNSAGFDVMIDAPSKLTNEELEEINLIIKPNKK